MALKQLLITRKIADLEAEKTQLLSAIAATAEKRAAWKLRENAAVAALEEITDDSTDEEREAFELEASEIEAENQTIADEEEQQNKRSSEIDTEIGNLKNELEEINTREKKQIQKPKTTDTTDKGDNNIMRIADRNAEYRERIREVASRQETRDFLESVRAIYRGVNNATLTVPEVMLPMLRDAIGRNTKLLKHVNVQTIKGSGKQNILASAPEAVWTEMLGKINELELTVNQIKIDGYKVAGFVPIPNPILEDSDENLTEVIINLLGQSLGYALDKAIVYGDGESKPIGIIPRLLAATQPTWWQNNMPKFTNISASHVGKQSATSVKDAALMQEMLTVLSKAVNKFGTGNGNQFWVMNTATWNAVKIMTMNFNSAGALVAGVNNELPIIGGAVETLDFIPDGVVAGGFGNHYLLAERADMKIAKSEDYMFVEDQTVFKGTARYDGIPALGEAFAAFSLNSNAVTASGITFAADTANAEAAANSEDPEE